MNNEIKEIYLSGLEWTKTHDNIGGVMGNLVFKHNISYEEYQKILKNTNFVLCDKDYITNLQEQIERLNNTMESYEAIVEKKDNKITDLQEENQRLNNIIKEAINYIDDNTYYKDHKGHINIDDVYIILQGEDNE